MDLLATLRQLGLSCTNDARSVRATSGTCLWDGTSVEVFVSQLPNGAVRVSDAGQAGFMALSCGMPAALAHWENLADGYQLSNDEHGYFRVVQDSPDMAQHLAAAARDLVAFQVAAFAYATALRDVQQGMVRVNLGPCSST